MNVVKRAKEKLFSATGMVGVALLVVGASAHAALPTAASTALTDVNTGITDAVDGAWPLIGAALVAVTVIKLVKRFTGKI